MDEVPGCVGQVLSSFRCEISTVLYLPSFITTVSWPGCLRIWTAIAKEGVMQWRQAQVWDSQEDCRREVAAEM